MDDKWTHRGVGALAGAALLAIVGFTWGGWVTSSGARAQADAAAWTALLPVCADAILGNPAAVAALRVKKASDYDDVVRDHLKSIGDRSDISFMFRRECGKAIESRMALAATKK